MKQISSTLALICVALTAITFSITACSDGAPDLGRSTKIDLSNEVSIEMIKVEAGTFEMSVMNGIKSGFGEVTHQATLTRDFYIGQTEVTQAQWQAVMGNNPARFSFKGDNLPEIQVSWNDAMEFCEKLNAMGKVPEGWMFTLPTETQWEYAARGGKKSKGYKYSGSNNIDEVAWYYGNSGNSRLDDSSWDIYKSENNNCRPHPVGQKKANELGLYDMSGNVYELCLDDWQDKSDKLKAEFTRENDRSKSDRAMRGGAFCYLSDLCHPARRNKVYLSGLGDRGDHIGIRLALVQSNNDKTEAKRNASKNDSTTADRGNAEEQHNLGLEYYKKGDYSKAVECFKKAAEQGHAEAQNKLGLCYRRGVGVKSDKAEAVKWFRKAADQGFAAAQFNLGDCYVYGEGVTQNQVEAVKWFRKAAEQGIAEAQWRFGTAFFLGFGGAENEAEAVKWIRKAADQGNENAKKVLKNLGY